MPSRKSPQNQDSFLFDAVTELIITLDPELRIQWANRTAGETANEDPEGLVGRHCYRVWHGRETPCENCPIQRCMRTGTPQENEFRTPDGRCWHIRGYPLLTSGGELYGAAKISQEITGQKKAEERLEQLEWMLQPGRGGHRESPAPEYGNLLELNTRRLILDSVGEDALKRIVKDFLDLLETSVAVYEANGDYALGIFSSTWCRFMDQASRRLCDTGSNREALTCGKWLCHESCWGAARDCMERGGPVDVECEGGIRLYAVPIRSRGSVIGTINLGYGDPPRDPATLNELAEKYNVDARELERHANAYESRPPFLVEHAKQRMETAAWLIGEIVERGQAEEDLRRSESYYRALFETSNTAMFIIEEDTTISHVNSRFEELTGYSGPEIEGIKSWTEFANPDDASWMREYHHLRRRDPDAAPRQYEFRFITRHGEERNLLLAIDMIPGTNRSIASGIDITERKHTERILQARLRLMEYTLTHSFEEILTATLDEAEELTDSRVGFYESLSGDQNTLTLLASSTRTERICSAPGKGVPYEVDLAGVWADCIRKGEAIVHNDYPSLPQKKGTPPGHPSITRELVVPVYKDDAIVAVLGVGNKPRSYSSADIEAVSLLAHLAWDITERKQMEERLRELSLYDTLTGLYNRNFFEEEMKRLSSGRHNPLGIVVADLDGLKFVNDTLGHQAGDQMLTATADLLRRNFRSSDIIARIGGDEFAILLTNTDLGVVDGILERLRRALEEHNSAEPDLPLSLSLGYAVSEEDTTDMQALFREADNRMYREKLHREKSPRSAIVQALTSSMRARDFDTEGHCDRLQELTTSLATSLDLSPDFVNDLVLLARFHDLGKVGIPDSVLFKRGSLSEEEWQRMRQHCEIGHRIASSVPDLEPIADYILKHHEWWDGRGYPLGLSGGDIPLPCRILAIADAFDAMTSDRPYRGAMRLEDAIAELRRCAGTQFDPELVEKFIAILQDFDEDPLGH